MLVPLIQFLVCAAAIIVAGTFLSRYADAIADITGLGKLLVGSVLLAGATSLPELTVDISAVRLGAVDLAVGDLLGSSLMNLLILAALDLSLHSRGKMFSRQAAAHALSGSLAASLTALVGLGLLTGKTLAPFSLFGVSPAVYLLVAAYILGVRLIYLDQRIAARAASAEEAPPAGPMSLSRALAGFAICAIAILISGPFLAHAADALAQQTGLGGTFVGTTLVAFSTSLPELVATLAALRLGSHDLAIGNIFGSNAFNMILLAPLDAVHPGSLLASVAPQHAITCFAVVMAMLVTIMGQLYHAESRTRLIEPDALLVIVIVVGSLTLIYFAK